jgi:hypothetical protein
LDTRLQKLYKLFSVFGNVSTAIDTLPTSDFAVLDSDTDGLEKHPILRAIVRAGKLIEMQPHLLDAPTTRFPDGVDPTEADSAAPHSLAALREIPPVAPEKRDESFHQGAVHTEERSAADAVVPRRSSNALPLTYEYDFAELKLDNASIQVSESEKNTGTSGIEKSLGFGKFDERLLKDLIDTYGEFAVSDKDTAASSPPAALLQKEDPAPESSRTESSRKDVSTALVLAAEPKFLGSNAAHEVPSPMREQESVGSTSYKSEHTPGEIDQQLKNIIRDYGEVDLYSQGKSANTKIGVIAAAAAALLVLILAGFYLLKTPSPTVSVPSSASTAEPYVPSASSVNNATPQK